MNNTRLSDPNEINRRYLDSILVEQRIIGSVLPGLETEFFGEHFTSPVMTPAFSHLPAYKGRELTGLEEYSIAAKNCGCANWVGMMENDLFEKITDTGARTVRIIKPYADKDKIFDQIAFAEKMGALGVGMDIDHVFGNGTYDVVLGEPMAPQSLDDLRAYVGSTKLPFATKGVLSVKDAALAAEAGAKAVVVSHHHGRLPSAVPPLMILPEIVKELEGSGMQIVVDCGMETGVDIYKALALGADAASVGRALLPGLEEKGAAGAQACLEKVIKELSMMMGSTGFSTVDEIDCSALWIGGKHLHK